MTSGDKKGTQPILFGTVVAWWVEEIASMDVCPFGVIADCKKGSGKGDILLLS